MEVAKPWIIKDIVKFTRNLSSIILLTPEAENSNISIFFYEFEEKRKEISYKHRQIKYQSYNVLIALWYVIWNSACSIM